MIGMKIMRVITGSARGRKLKTLDSLDIRPTPDAVKEALFSVIQFDIPAASVLDLFAGSGQLGIEALSRGAKHCVFVDKSADAVAIVKDNVSACRFNDCSRVLHMDSLEYIKVSKGGFDIALLDPPYRHGLIEQAMQGLAPLMNVGGFAICEHEAETTLPDEFPGFILHKRYRYGKVAVTIYRTPDADGE